MDKDLLYPRNPFPVPPLLPAQAPQSLHEALNVYAPPDFIDQYIKNNPNSIHQPGFNGQSPLHKAIMTSDLPVLEVLLNHGSNPNAKNNFDETPFHFASRRGNPQILYMLVKYGADPRCLDKAGKGAVIFAAHGGAVANLQYVTSYLDLSLFVSDDKGLTPLHVVCAHGHADAFMYLLRKERCDVFQKDNEGNTALHACVGSCNTYMIWNLLEKGGRHLLHELNNEGYTALDLAKKGDTQRHSIAAQVLETYSRMSSSKSDKEIRGPSLVWWWHLVAPAVIYAAALMVAHSVVSYKGLVMVLGIVALMLVVVQQGHRMKHVSRWPNPMYVGMFASGLFHTVICFYFLVLPTIYKDHKWLAVYSVQHFIVICYMYYRLLTIDPGRQTQPMAKSDGTFYELKDVAALQVKLQSYCTACEFVNPARTKHCRLCQVCLLDMDHHCLFLYRCIARANHRLFIRFILVVVLAMVLFEYSAVQFLKTEYEGSELNHDLWVTVFSLQPWLWSAMLFNAGSIVWGLCLLRTQLNVVARGHTSYFQIYSSRHKIKGLQLYINMVRYLLGKKLNVIETKDGIKYLNI